MKTKHEGMDYDNLFGIGIPDIFMNMLSCQVFINNSESIVIIKCPNRISQYYFNNRFIQLPCDKDHLEKIPENVKERVGAEMEMNTNLVMICHTTITSTSYTLKNLYIGKDCHSLYLTDDYNDQTKAMERLFSTYITPQIKEIYHLAIIQEWKLNIDAAEYEKNMPLTHLPSSKIKLIVLTISNTGLRQ